MWRMRAAVDIADRREVRPKSFRNMHHPEGLATGIQR